MCSLLYKVTFGRLHSKHVAGSLHFSSAAVRMWSSDGREHCGDTAEGRGLLSGSGMLRAGTASSSGPSSCTTHGSSGSWLSSFRQIEGHLPQYLQKDTSPRTTWDCQGLYQHLVAATSVSHKTQLRSVPHRQGFNPGWGTEVADFFLPRVLCGSPRCSLYLNYLESPLLRFGP